LKLKRSMTILLIILIAVLLIGGGVYFLWLKYKTNEVTVGVLVLKDDVLATSVLNGVDLATREWNASSSNKTKINLVKIEHTNSTAAAKSAFNEMITKYEPVAIIGSPYSSIVVPLIADIQAAGIPYFTGATGTQITEDNQNGWIFRTQTKDDIVVEIAMKYFVNVFEYSKFAVLYTDSFYGQSANRAAINYSANLGVSVVKSLPFDLAKSDISKQVDEINGSDVDLTLIWATSDDGPKILEMLKTYNLNMPFIGSEGFIPMKSSDVFPEQANGSYIAVDYIPKTIDKDWVSKVESIYGRNSANFITTGYYDTANLLYKAITNAGTESNKLKSYIKSTTYSGIVGGYSFDKNGESLRQSYLGRIINGKLDFLKLEILD